MPKRTTRAAKAQMKSATAPAPKLPRNFNATVKAAVLEAMGQQALFPSRPLVAQQVHPISGSPFLNQPRVVSNFVTEADISRDYVGSNVLTFAPSLKSLTWATDDIACEFGTDVYEKMARDPEVGAALETVVMAACGSEISLYNPAASDHPEHEEGERILKFFKWMLERDQTLNSAFRSNMTRNALKFGSSVAEIDFDAVNDDGDYNGFLMLSDAKVKALKDTSFVVDPYDNVVGVIPTRVPNLTVPVGSLIPLRVTSRGATGPQNQRIKGILPRSKFLVYTWNKTQNDPRGNSWLTSAYMPWWLKQQVINEFLSWLARFAQMSLWGETAPNALPQCVTDPTTGVEVTMQPTEVLLQALQQIKSGSVAAVPNGASINSIETKGTGDIFLVAMQKLDQMIVRALMKQHLATQEGEHQARSSSETHQDILSLMILSIKQWQADAIRQDVLRQLTVLNFGENKAHLTPKVNLGDGDGFPVSVAEAGQLFGQALTDYTDLPALVKQLGLPMLADAPEQPTAQDKLDAQRRQFPTNDERDDEDAGGEKGIIKAVIDRAARMIVKRFRVPRFF